MSTPEQRDPIRSYGPYLLAAAVGGLLVWGALQVDFREPRAVAVEPLPNAATLAADTFEWTDQPAPVFPIPPYARFLADVRIVLDPGHGGRGDLPNYKRGPTGLREAEVNLRVAQYLREFLDAVGAVPILTREADEFLDETVSNDLQQRAELAQRANADLLISIHHNAAGNPDANYTTVFYHATPTHSPASRDAARHLLAGLQDALRLEQGLECGLLSDYAVYPAKGFRVLRDATVPAVLTESSFHTHPQEERRLANAVYNRREAYGLFLGLARWAQAGLPRVVLLKPGDAGYEKSAMTVRLEDGLTRRGGWGRDLPKILERSIEIRLDDRPVEFTADLKKRLVRVRRPRESAGELFVDFTNIFGQHVLHPRIKLQVAHNE